MSNQSMYAIRWMREDRVCWAYFEDITSACAVYDVMFAAGKQPQLWSDARLLDRYEFKHV